MDTDIQEPVPENANVQIPFAKESIYSNGSALGFTEFDARISFAEIMQDRSVVAKIGVVMPVEHAAILCLNLFTLLLNFEKANGEIRHPLWKNFVAGAMWSSRQENITGVGGLSGSADKIVPNV